jgi:hypothetical protein
LGARYTLGARYLSKNTVSESITLLDKAADKNKTQFMFNGFYTKFCGFRNNIKTTRRARIVTYTMALFVNMLVAKYTRKHVIRKD